MISAQIEKLLGRIKAPKDDPTANSDEPTITINEIVKKAGVFYEKIRYSVDYKEEHTIRRSAIERILNRNLFFGENKNVALFLIQELIRGGYIENNTVKERKVIEVQNIINRYLALFKFVQNNGEKEVIFLKKKILSLAASEIEIYFFDNRIESAVMESYYETVKKQVNLSKITYVTDEDKDIQLYIACRRSIYKNDDQTITYQLWNRFVPDWTKVKDSNEIERVANVFYQVNSKIEKSLVDQFSWYILPKLKNLGIYFSVIKELFDKYGVEAERMINEPGLLKEHVESILEAKYKKVNEKTRKSAFRAIIYIFITKMILAFSVELPFDIFILGQIAYLSLAINVVFHPTLLFFITSTIKPLKSDNTVRVLNGIESIVYDKGLPMIHIKPRKDKNLLYTVLILIYTVIFLVCFGAIIWALRSLDFSVVSIFLFIMFLTLVSYFGLRIRYTAKDWLVSAGEEKTRSFLWGLLTLPIVEAGKWLNNKFATINIFVFILDFIIETPFKLVLEILDSFVSFLKEKKEQIN